MEEGRQSLFETNQRKLRSSLFISRPTPNEGKELYTYNLLLAETDIEWYFGELESPSHGWHPGCQGSRQNGSSKSQSPKRHERRRLMKKSRQPHSETDQYEVSEVVRVSLFVQGLSVCLSVH